MLLPPDNRYDMCRGQTIPIAELELAWAEDYMGISKKNAYLGIDMMKV